MKKHEYQPPQVIPGTTRVKVITPDGKALEHMRIYMPAEAWEALKRLCINQKLSCSQAVEKLVLLADKTAHQSESTRRVTEIPWLLTSA